MAVLFALFGLSHEQAQVLAGGPCRHHRHFHARASLTGRGMMDLTILFGRWTGGGRHRIRPAGKNALSASVLVMDRFMALQGRQGFSFR